MLTMEAWQTVNNRLRASGREREVAMGRFYGLKIKAGEMEPADVPPLWRPAAEAWLGENE